MTHLQLLALLCITGAAAVVDARTGKIPNRLLIVGLVLALVVQVGLATTALAAATALGSALVGMLAGSILPVALYQARVLGGGDVKLLAVVGALIAAGPGIELTLGALLVVGLFGLVKRITTGRLPRALSLLRGERLVTAGPQPPVEARATIELPFGPAIFVAACYLAVVHWPLAEAAAAADASAPLPSAQRSRDVVRP